MKSMIVIALALTSVVSFSATSTKEVSKACADLKGKELSACEAKNAKATAVVAPKKTATATATAATTTTTTTAASTPAPTATPVKK